MGIGGGGGGVMFMHVNVSEKGGRQRRRDEEEGGRVGMRDRELERKGSLISGNISFAGVSISIRMAE